MRSGLFFFGNAGLMKSFLGWSRNVDLEAPARLSSWRKVAIGTWGHPGDPSVYGSMDIDAEPVLAYIEKLRIQSGRRVTLTHVVGRIIAETFKRHPGVNCLLRLGRLYPRKSIDVFFQVAADPQGEELTGVTIRDADKKSIIEICREMEDRVALIRAHQDASFAKVKKTMPPLPAGWCEVFWG